jgi:lipopolysaccharide/colanic/teichoic acid biosynthesis glycosyltransferase
MLDFLQKAGVLRRTGAQVDWNRLRVQLGGCLIVAALIPFLIRSLTAPELSPPGQLEKTFIATVVAIALGTWALRSLSNYPGFKAASYVLPTFGLSFAAILLAIFLGRTDYNRSLLLAGFVLSTGWFLFVTTRASRQNRLHVGLAPFGATELLQDLREVRYTPLHTPEVRLGEFDAIIADLRADIPDEWDRCLADYALLGVPVYHIKALYESITGRVEIEHLSENSFGSLVPNSAYFALKTVVDLFFAVLALLLLAPFLVALAVAIKIDSRGPVIFEQQRVGYRGRIFTMYKFRSMTVEEPSTGIGREAAITLTGDRRVTRVGRAIRKLRIDELPQLLNILKGEMSWIGPRPEAVVLSQWYEAEIPFYRYRHIVRPGITGWAQVTQGHVADVDEVRSKLHYDFYYIKNFSPWIDLLIVARTIKTMLTGFGSK